jgi:hypothetical protein
MRLRGRSGLKLIIRIFIEEKLDFENRAPAAGVVAWSLPRVETVNIDNE